LGFLKSPGLFEKTRFFKSWAVGGHKSRQMKFIDVFAHFNAYFVCSVIFAGNAETEVG